MKHTTRHSGCLWLVLCWVALTHLPIAHAQNAGQAAPPPVAAPSAAPSAPAGAASSQATPIAPAPAAPSAAPQPSDAGLSAGVPQPAAPTEAAAPIAPAPTSPAAPQPRAARPTQPQSPKAQSSDLEHAPAATSDERELGRWMIRLGLGFQAGFYRMDGESTLRKPGLALLDFGFAPISQLVVLLRVSSWLSYEPFAFQFIGLGVNYLLGLDGMFLTGVVGLSLVNDQLVSSSYQGRIQGLGAHIDLGQQWPINSMLGFSIGAHFELGTPALGNLSVTHFGVGLFAALSWRDPIEIKNGLR